MTNSPDGSKSRRPARKPYTDDLDPTGVTTLPELLSTLRELCRRAGMTSGALQAWANQNNKSLPKGTLSEVYSGKLHFRRPLLLGITEACGLNEGEIDKWDKAWARATEKSTKLDPAEIPVLKQATKLRANRAAEIERQTSKLTDDEEVLRQALARAIEQRDQLKDKVEKLRLDLTVEQDDAKRLQQRYIEIEIQVAVLRAELRFAQDKLQRIEAERDRLIAEQAAAVELEDTLYLYRDRAEYALRQRDESEQAKDKLQKKVAELEELLVNYISQVNDEPVIPEASLVPTYNNPMKVQVSVPDGVFGRYVTATIPYAWFCDECDRGGQQSRAICPHCGHAVARNCHKEISIWLPVESSYDRTIRVLKGGYWDNPSAPAGDLCVTIVREPGSDT